MVSYPSIPEEELKAEYDKLKTAKTDKISLANAEKALIALGFSEEDAAKVVADSTASDSEGETHPIKKEQKEEQKRGFLGRMFKGSKTAKTQEIPYREFKQLAAPSRLPYGSTVDDTFGVGIVSCAMADAFGFFEHGKAPDEDKIKEAFTEMDTTKNGKLDKGEIAEGMRALGRSERQVQKVIDGLEAQELNFEEFKLIFLPESRPWMTELGPLPFPNREKVLDCPGVGHLMNFAGHVLCEPVDAYARSLHKGKGFTDAQLNKEFKALNKDNKISKKDAAQVMRTKGAQTEMEIKQRLGGMKRDPLTLYEFKKAVRGSKFAPSTASSVPIVGESFSAASGHHEYEADEEEGTCDLKEHWDFIILDNDQKDKLDKQLIYLLCLELGMADRSGQEICDSMQEEEIDFEAFKTLIHDPPPKEGLSRVHDVPLLGSVTTLGSHAGGAAWGYTGGALSKRYQKPTDEQLQEKWDEVDTGKKKKLPKKELAKVLRALGEYESLIKTTLEKLPEDPVPYDDYKLVVQGPPPPPPAPAAEPAAAGA